MNIEDIEKRKILLQQRNIIESKLRNTFGLLKVGEVFYVVDENIIRDNETIVRKFTPKQVKITKCCISLGAFSTFINIQYLQGDFKGKFAYGGSVSFDFRNEFLDCDKIDEQYIEMNFYRELSECKRKCTELNIKHNGFDICPEWKNEIVEQCTNENKGKKSFFKKMDEILNIIFE
jgi:hypothetical protein